MEVADNSGDKLNIDPQKPSNSSDPGAGDGKARDLERVHRLKNGDRKALEEIVKEYQNSVYRLAYSLLQDREDALDVAQEAFLRVHQAISRFAEKAAFSTWLYRIVVNLCHDVRRKRMRRKDEFSLDQVADERDESGDPPLQIADPKGESPSEFSAERELERKVKEAMESLPDKHRITLILREVEGLSYEEIAQMTEVSLGTVMSRLHYGRKKLQEILQPFL
ncbi:MAG: RNA polymerase sigma factor SigE [Candidatus Hinthialibacteria bacterium]|nr:MAG: ECF RNA polymerase sigma-E factor [Candidatus Hinthialibacteria bacterium OLB16]MBV6480868.1 ECF RNA polymerase sigma-E factor [bacterium]MCE7908631.1 sigma-70 family RNA polymerase sigma factor [Candidatus Omnitrophica bacterium COP1]